MMIETETNDIETRKHYTCICAGEQGAGIHRFRILLRFISDRLTTDNGMHRYSPVVISDGCIIFCSRTNRSSRWRQFIWYFTSLRWRCTHKSLGPEATAVWSYIIYVYNYEAYLISSTYVKLHIDLFYFSSSGATRMFAKKSDITVKW